MKKLMVIIIMVCMLSGCGIEHKTEIKSYRVNESYEANTIRIIKTEKR